MKKLTLILLLIPFLTQAQVSLDFNDDLLSSDKKLIRMAVDSSLCIIRQDYNLKSKSGDEYGRAGKDYFGRRYTLGVMSENKIWANSRITTPWENDRFFDPYKKIDTIKPQLANVAFKKLMVGSYQTLDIKPETYDSSNVVTYKTEFKESIANLRSTKASNGWLVIVHSKEDLAINEKSTINYTIYNPSPQFQVNSMEGLIKKMPVKENVIGGFYFITTIKSGEIKFQVAGILRNKGTEWYIDAIPTTDKTISNQLTPIKNSKSDPQKKNEEKSRSKREEKKADSKI